MITIIGSLNIDLMVYTKYFPGSGETITSQHYVDLPGGKGANQAVTIGRLGGQVEMIGAVGKDLYGQRLLNNLKANGIGTSGIKECSGANTGLAFINVDETGSNKIILIPGANHLLVPTDIDQNMHLIDQSHFILLQLEIPLATVHYALREAYKRRKKTILNPAPACKLSPEILQYVDILTPNELELALLTNLPVDSLDAMSVAAKTLIQQGVKVVIVTLGDKGVLVVASDKVSHIPAYPVKVVDTTAAGDAFTGALVLALSQGDILQDAVHFANKVASIVVQRPGTQISLPTLNEIK
ncbi:ribokinase [Sporanaerobium hydrogeniformans]|uniref:ribokinase n=1 Tax=Sporanaerobium hydrogeniformans TaxID=3072179 RepID=UPI0026D9FFE5|nr:ribokinase [Sporanaerobium hydrogeniformans]